MKATKQQIKFFFVLCGQAHVDKEKATKRAEKLYGLEKFSDISINQISFLIDALQKKIKQEAHPQGEVPSTSNSIHARIYDTSSGKMLYSHFAKTGRDKGVVMYFPLSYAVNRAVKDEEEIDIMLGTGKFDVNNLEIYRYDIFINKKREKWLVDLDPDLLMWVANNVETDEQKALHLFSKVKIVGSVYSEVLDE